MERIRISDQYEWGMLKIWEVASHLYVDESKDLGQPECNVFLYSITAKKRALLGKMRWCGTALLLRPLSNKTPKCE